ncbi:MAG: radical SAM protein [Deltaproteobacteria bacterium]|nr:radical SAM protein [Deltaproteobacteria bacterium]
MTPSPQLDCCLLVPQQTAEMMWLDPAWRGTRSPWIYRFAEASLALEGLLGRRLDTEGLRFGGKPIEATVTRSLTAVALATALEEADLTWRAIDPGVRLLADWRKLVKRAARWQPRVVGISTTFVASSVWLNGLLSLVRRFLPRARIAVGGMFYATSPRDFLGLDADVFCTGAGEARLVEIVAALRDEQPLERVAGLYLRDGHGEISSTGPAAPESLAQSSPPDWELARRIEPTVDLDTDAVFRGAQTQRGCAYQCEFCAIRGSVGGALDDPAAAAQRILDAGRGRRGVIQLADSTASHPRDRWRSILKILSQHGGTSVPLRANVRAPDVDDRTAGLMVSAGVREVLIGQESGDQRMLDRMRKGLQVDQLRPALQSLAAHDLNADVSFIVGFPGEDETSIAATRDMLLSLNDGCEDRPVVLSARVIVFEAQAFAGVTQRDGARGLAHSFAYPGPIDAARAERERLDMFLASSRKDSAPITNLTSRHLAALRYAMVTMPKERHEIFHWLKAVERGIGIYLAQALHHTRPNPAELDRVKQTIQARYDGAPSRAWFGRRWRHQAQRRWTARLASEWQGAARPPLEVATRLLLSTHVARTTGGLKATLRTALTGKLPTAGGGDGSPAARRRRDRLADQLVEDGHGPSSQDGPTEVH